MRFDRRTPLWGVISVAALFGALIWALSPAITGVVEPWDASAPYYFFALPVAGFVSGMLTGRPPWAHYAGVIAGQFLFGLAVLRFGPLILLGVSFLAVYGLLFLGGSMLGFGVRNRLAAQERHEHAPLRVIDGGAEVTALERYDGQSTEQLLEMRETHRADSLVFAFEEGLQRKQAGAPLSVDERNLLSAVGFLRATDSGGFTKFLRNTSTDLLLIAVSALNAFDCPKAALLCQDAFEAVGSIDSSWRIEQALANPSVQHRLAECDALLRGSDEVIAVQLLQWIDEHPGKIRLGD